MEPWMWVLLVMLIPFWVSFFIGSVITAYFVAVERHHYRSLMMLAQIEGNKAKMTKGA